MTMLLLGRLCTRLAKMLDFGMEESETLEKLMLIVRSDDNVMVIGILGLTYVIINVIRSGKMENMIVIRRGWIYRD
jgi:hypothetical protein